MEVLALVLGCDGDNAQGRLGTLEPIAQSPALVRCSVLERGACIGESVDTRGISSVCFEPAQHGVHQSRGGRFANRLPETDKIGWLLVGVWSWRLATGTWCRPCRFHERCPG